MPSGGRVVHVKLDRAYLETVLHDMARFVLERELPADIHLKVRLEQWPQLQSGPVIITTLTDRRVEPPISETRIWPLEQLIEERRG